MFGRRWQPSEVQMGILGPFAFAASSRYAVPASVQSVAACGDAAKRNQTAILQPVTEQSRDLPFPTGRNLCENREFIRGPPFHASVEWVQFCRWSQRTPVSHRV